MASVHFPTAWPLVTMFVTACKTALGGSAKGMHESRMKSNAIFGISGFTRTLNGAP